MSDLDSKLIRVEGDMDRLTALRLELREEVMDMLMHVESGVDNTAFEFARVRDEVKKMKEGLEDHTVNSDERFDNLDTLRLSLQGETLDRIALSERMMDACRTELSYDTAKVTDLCNDIEKKMAASEATIETINSAITTLLLEVKPMGSLLSTAVADVTINTSEIKHVKVMVDAEGE
jgi:septation ring formation regulator EzrA